ncbi:hypothetical protein [Candidatus Vidania fulgoroideorum]
MKVLKLFFEKGSKKSNINSCLGQNGINILKFNNILKKEIKDYKDKIPIRIHLNIKNKNEFDVINKNYLTSSLIKNFCYKIFKSEKKINTLCLEKIYCIKKKSFNTRDKNKIFRIILGTAKSMSYNYVQ